MSCSQLRNHNGWYNSITSRITALKGWDGINRRKFQRLDQVERFSGRIRALAPMCEACRNAEDLLDYIVATCSEKPGDGGDPAECSRILGTISRHLQHSHKIVPAGYCTLMGLLWGAGAGTLLGTLLLPVMLQLPPGVGIAVGAGLGLITGILLELEARRDRRVL